MTQFSQPDVIPTHTTVQQAPVTPQPDEVPPPAQFVNDQSQQHDIQYIPPVTTTQIAEDIYENVQRKSVDAAHNSATEATVHVAGVESEAIYQNQQDLAEYIEDTGIRAVALYDYEAAAEDEISFDPDDLITHIEQVRHIFNVAAKCTYI